MAIIEGIPGIKVTVRINNVDCAEYDDPNPPEEEPERPTSTKYVESHDDTEFTVHVAVNNEYQWGHRNHLLLARLYVDSAFIGNALMMEKYLDINKCYERTIEGRKAESNEARSLVLQRLKFSTVKTVDDATKERVKKDQKISNKLGLIVVEIRREIKLGRSKHRPNRNLQTVTPTATSFELAEKSLKGRAISHGTTLSAPESIRRSTYCHTEPVPGDSGPIAIFRFLYRSKGALQQELVLPTTPPPPATLDRISEAELHRLARERLEQIKAEKRIKEEGPAKREFGEVFDPTDDGSGARSFKAPRRAMGVIDLTSED
ncbi:uncharacterized protein F4822DRAFT_404832 [Hypoxylon trugodes]|uniref:uncharacterized protein n=1 Tax=Hypoxylon trugodes TaxID=326681 RepID=UPI00219EDD49|nr:uncharacterized protein F4822DRAFT_404832 [Hypoxylon trugodes]KAI1389058.1 hypothetical protein F4822DRAFT_404832 [Hypoxylon trugodes]